MSDSEFLTTQFEELRPHLRAVAYRMLGSVSEADDALQDAWLRVARADASRVENMGGWLTTMVARVCLNMLRARRTRREEPLAPHVPDPIVSRAAGVDPEQEALLSDGVGLAAPRPGRRPVTRSRPAPPRATATSTRSSPCSTPT